MSAPSGYQLTQVPKMSPEAKKLYNQLIGSLGSGPQKGLDYLQRLAGGDEDIFKQIEAPAYQALQQQMAQTAGRFSGVGAQDSSAFANALAGQSGQMAQNLAAQRQSLQQGAIGQLLGFSKDLMSTSPDEYLLQESGLDYQSLIEAFGPAIIGLIASLAGGPVAGAAAGGIAAGGLSRKPYG